VVLTWSRRRIRGDLRDGGRHRPLEDFYICSSAMRAARADWIGATRRFSPLRGRCAGVLVSISVVAGAIGVTALGSGYLV
jgi:hypothetical protein